MRNALIMACVTLFCLGTLLTAVSQQAENPAQKVASASEKKETKSTLQNLQEAFNGESNAKNKYEAYSKKADEEGYARAAALFRAAAKSESVHAKNHAAVIEKLGGKAEAKIEQPEIKATKENLLAAAKGESYERDTMYPPMIEQAKKDGNRDAVRTLNGAKNVEAGHAILFQQAADKLDNWKVKKDFYVCKVCGNTVEEITFEKCPVCRVPKDEFEKVS